MSDKALFVGGPCSDAVGAPDGDGVLRASSRSRKAAQEIRGAFTGLVNACRTAKTISSAIARDGTERAVRELSARAWPLQSRSAALLIDAVAT
jgi:hypothetical protein